MAGSVSSVSKDCVICMEAARAAVFVPCNHNICCLPCAQAVVQRGDACPLCRAKVTSILAGQFGETLVKRPTSGANNNLQGAGTQAFLPPTAHQKGPTQVPSYGSAPPPVPAYAYAQPVQSYQPTSTPPPAAHPQPQQQPHPLSQSVVGSNPAVLSPPHVLARPTTFNILNHLGTSITVTDQQQQVLFVGDGKVALTYKLRFFDASNNLLCRLESELSHLNDYFNIKYPNNIVFGMGRRSILQLNTSVHVYAGSSTQTELYRIKGNFTASQLQVLSTNGTPVATISRNAGVMTDIRHTVVAQPGVDGLLMVVLAVMCTCMKSERKFVAAGVAALAAPVLL